MGLGSLKLATRKRAGSYKLIESYFGYLPYRGAQKYLWTRTWRAAEIREDGNNVEEARRSMGKKRGVRNWANLITLKLGQRLSPLPVLPSSLSLPCCEPAPPSVTMAKTAVA